MGQLVDFKRQVRGIIFGDAFLGSDPEGIISFKSIYARFRCFNPTAWDILASHVQASISSGISIIQKPFERSVVKKGIDEYGSPGHMFLELWDRAIECDPVFEQEKRLSNERRMLDQVLHKAHELAKQL